MGSDSDQELLKAFIEGDGSRPSGRDEQRAQLVTRLRDHLVWHVARQRPGQRARYDDLEADALVLLMEWRAKGLLVATEPLWRLSAWRLVQQVCRAEYRERQRRQAETAEVDPELVPDPTDHEGDFSRRELLGRLMALFGLLPALHAEALGAQIAEELGHGPSLEVALGCDRAAARKRLERARIALAALAVEHGLAASLTESGVNSLEERDE